jgi:signal transduction histidine kinase
MFLAGLALTAIIVVVPAVCGVVRGRRRPLVRLLSERNDYLERTRELAAVQARRDERVRITGEMHDTLGHRLSLLSMHAGALELRAAQDAPALGEQVRVVRSTAVAAMQELRQILQLAPAGTAGAAPSGAGSSPGTRGDVESIVRESGHAGLDVGFDWLGPDLAGADPRTGHAVHRIVREGLTNAHKHAPGAPAVRVEVDARHADREDGRVRVRVVNAPPPEPTAAGPGTRRGLAGLEERVMLLGGTLAAGPLADGGYALAADLPVRPSAAVPVPDLDLAQLDGPPPVRRSDTMTTRRALAVVALALVVPVLTALALFALLPR